MQAAAALDRTVDLPICGRLHFPRATDLPKWHRDTMWHKTWLRQTIPLYNLQAQDCEAAVWLVEFWFFLNMYCLARNVKPHEREPHFHVIGR